MKVFVDTNIFIDILLNRKEFINESKQVYKLCANHIAHGREVKMRMQMVCLDNIFHRVRSWLI